MLNRIAHITAIALPLLLSSTAYASPLDHTLDAIVSRNFTAMINNIAHKSPGTTGQIQCYSLPYGAIGFVSHILTYWTLFCMVKGIRPLMFWKPITKRLWGVWLAATMLVLTISVSVWTIVRCREDWQLLVIAVWKLTMSVTLGCVCLHRSQMLKRDSGGIGYQQVHGKSPGIDGKSPGIDGNGEEANPVRLKLLAWLPIYGCGIVVGMSGLVSLVHHNWHNHLVQIVTVAFAGAVFGTAIVGTALISAILALSGNGGGAGGFFAGGVFGFSTVVGLIGVLSAFYSDWILAAVMGNMVGQPSSDVAPLYYTYFVAKRLPFFAI
ncbi:MAG: hypothetical protein M1839_003983 [Geoglossum umbratile]|nr:MAG: hypothetical protein M1839_003983 [Geoglossum umbratile]